MTHIRYLLTDLSYPIYLPHYLHNINAYSFSRQMSQLMPVATCENLTMGTRAWRMRWTLMDWGRTCCKKPAIISRVRWVNLRPELSVLILLRKNRPPSDDAVSLLGWPCIHHDTTHIISNKPSYSQVWLKFCCNGDEGELGVNITTLLNWPTPITLH